MNDNVTEPSLRQQPSMFCFQCQEASKGTGCTLVGVCGKPHDVANLQDLLICLLKGISFLSLDVRLPEGLERRVSMFIMDSLFATITNANFDRGVFVGRIREAISPAAKCVPIITNNIRKERLISLMRPSGKRIMNPQWMKKPVRLVSSRPRTKTSARCAN
ncbi:hypothetical protein VQ056_27540 [Paenibacillus sp. JTLBN-2024]